MDEMMNHSLDLTRAPGRALQFASVFFVSVDLVVDALEFALKVKLGFLKVIALFRVQLQELRQPFEEGIVQRRAA